MQNKPLGKGLSVLLGKKSSEIIDNLPIKELQTSKFQPRKFFDLEKHNSLVESIREKGVLQPIIVRKALDDKYEIVAGERRYRAAKVAGFKSVPVIIKEISNQEALEIALIENIQRSDLSPIEEAEGYKKLIKEFSYTQEDLSKIMGKSRSYITNSLRLLNLPESVKLLLNSGQLSSCHARAIVNVENPETFAKDIIDRKLSVRQVERLSRNNNKSNVVNRSEQLELEGQLNSIIGMDVKVKFNKENGGVISIKYKNLIELDQFIQKLTG